jgi:hypothetical protein
MASPHPTTKPSVNLATPAVRKSRIRRDPPPTAKAKEVLDPEEQEQWTVVVGILTFALAIFVITVAFGSYAGWSPSEYNVQM